MRRSLCLVVWLVLPGTSTAVAQQLEPRVYLASPVGSHLILVAAATSRGDVVFDPALPVTDAHARVGSVIFGYYRSFGLFGRAASLGGTMPIVRGTASGLVAGEARRAERLGAGDASVRLTVNLVGSPALDTAAFVKRGRQTNLGASLIVTAPIGQYDPTKVINIGANRWAYKPEVGVSVPLGDRWLFDAYGGVWLFTANSDFVGGRSQQAPLFTSQFHLSYNLSPRTWAAVNATFYAGGRVTTNGVANVERLQNTRLGATVSLPLARRQALRFAVSTGTWVRTGTDFTTFSLSWNYAWGPGF